MSDNCIVCNGKVRPRQEALQCDGCYLSVYHQRLCEERGAGETGSPSVCRYVRKKKTGLPCCATRSAESTSLATSGQKDNVRLRACSLDGLQGVVTRRLPPRMSIPLDPSVVEKGKHLYTYRITDTHQKKPKKLNDVFISNMLSLVNK